MRQTWSRSEVDGGKEIFFVRREHGEGTNLDCSISWSARLFESPFEASTSQGRSWLDRKTMHSRITATRRLSVEILKSLPCPVNAGSSFSQQTRSQIQANSIFRTPWFLTARESKIKHIVLLLPNVNEAESPKTSTPQITLNPSSKNCVDCSAWY